MDWSRNVAICLQDFMVWDKGRPIRHKLPSSGWVWLLMDVQQERRIWRRALEA